MDLQFFWNILARRKWLILVVMVITAIAAFLFVGRLDPKYKSEAQFSTGIIDFKGLNPEEDIFYLQKFSVEISFGNLIELMKSQRNLRFLNYRLLLHDLQSDKPFRVPDEDKMAEIAYTENDLQELILNMEKKLVDLDISLSDAKLDKLYRELALAYGYDSKGLLLYNLTIERNNDTDFLKIEFESESPELSYFAVENFCNDFLRNYDNLQQEEDNVTVDLLLEQVAIKEKAYLSKKAELDSYKGSKNLVDLESQRQAVVTQMTELELQRQTAFEKITPLISSIADLERRLAQLDLKSSSAKGESVVSNTAILNLQKQVDKLNEQWADSGYKDKKIESRISLFEKQLQDQIKRIAVLEPQSEEDELEPMQDKFLAQKVDLEIELRRAREAVATLDQELDRLRGRSSSLVSSEAYINGLEQDFQILFDEYKTLNSELSKKSIDLKDVSYPVKLVTFAQLADEAEPDHQLILSAFSSVVSGMMCVVLIFFLAFLDMSLSNPSQFQKFTNLVPLGSVNKINDKKIDIKNLFQSTSKDAKSESFKESLRNIRYQIESSGGKKFLFTSTNIGEGKTFLIVHLAHVLTLKDKKVLLIDANFKHNSLTQMSNQDRELGLLNSRLIGESDLSDDFLTQSPDNLKSIFDGVDIIGNKGSNQSPSEVFAGKDFHSFISELEKRYDYIFIESAAMNKYSDTKELVEYSDKVVAIFSAESEIRHSDREAISFLQGLGNQFMGAILNKVDLKNIS